MSQSNSGMPAAIAMMDAQNVRTKSGSKLARKIQQWQEQRLKNVQAIIDEYNTKGWNQQETLRLINNSIQDNVSEDSSGNLHRTDVEHLKQDFKGNMISARDIFLPPFLEGLTGDEIEEKR